MKRFTLLLPDGGAANQNTLFAGNKVTDPTTLCKCIKALWCKWAGNNNFTEWAKELNEDENYSGTFTVADALDNLCSNFHLEIDGKAIDLYVFFRTYLPLKTK